MASSSTEEQAPCGTGDGHDGAELGECGEESCVQCSRHSLPFSGLVFHLLEQTTCIVPPPSPSPCPIETERRHKSIGVGEHRPPPPTPPPRQTGCTLTAATHTHTDTHTALCQHHTVCRVGGCVDEEGTGVSEGEGGMAQNVFGAIPINR